MAESIGVRVRVRCGQCIGCRLSRAREWAARVMHESQLHEASQFVTLTYDEEHLPAYGSLRAADHQGFVKRLRSRLAPSRIRFFGVGEYGSQSLRPHYHSVLFGLDLPDRVAWSTSGSGHPLFRSELLEACWGMGHVLVGDVTFESAQYVAKYATKSLTVSKFSSAEAQRRYAARYERFDPVTGEVVSVEPERVLCSRRPGIGAGWYAKFRGDVYPSDEVVQSGRVMPAPRYYDKLLEREAPELFSEVKRARIAQRDRSDDSEARLEAMERCAVVRSSLHGERD